MELGKQTIENTLTIGNSHVIVMIILAINYNIDIEFALIVLKLAQNLNKS